MEKTITKIIPTLPGVYLFKNALGEVVYIGKAKSLRPRVHSYFQKTNTDWKVEEIRSEYADIDFIITHSETEAMLLEADLIQRYQPRFNTIFKTGQPFLYIQFTSPRNEIPSIEITRNKKKKGTHFGPFLHKRQARSMHQFLMRTFQLNACNKKIENGCLDYHLGNCSGTCKSDFDKMEYLFRLDLAKEVLRKRNKQFIAMIKEKMLQYNAELAFEKSKRLAEYIENVETIFETIKAKYSADKFATDIFIATTPAAGVEQIHNQAGKELAELLGLSSTIRSIDCFDISHFQSRFIVGSCIRFVDGKPDKNKFRRFKIQSLDEQNDYAALQEIVSRRYKDINELPDLMLIDGGKGQLSSVQTIFPKAHIVSLAKKEETLFSTNIKNGIRLDVKTNIGKLLISLRDYAHHFAITYHRLKRSKELS